MEGSRNEIFTFRYKKYYLSSERKLDAIKFLLTLVPPTWSRDFLRKQFPIYTLISSLVTNMMRHLERLLVFEDNHGPKSLPCYMEILFSGGRGENSGMKWLMCLSLERLLGPS